MANACVVRVCLVASVAWTVAGPFAMAQAQVVKDPGVRGGPPAAGGPLAGLSNFPGELGFFYASQTFFDQINSVQGTISSETGGPGLGPRYNLNQCSGCHAQPASGGTSPAVNPEVAAATRDGARNVVPPFVTLNGPVREARFVNNPDGTPDGGVHNLYTITGRIDAPGCNIAQPNFAAELAANNVIFRIPTPIFGLGLVEGVSDAGLQKAFAANGALKAQLGVSGHFNYGGVTFGDGTITRFGWKAQDKSLLFFSGEAYNVEMGVTNELFPNERDTTPSCQFNGLPEDMTIFGTSDPVSPPTGSTASDFSTGIVNFAMFMRLTAPPTPAPPTPSSMRGSQVFNNIGCQTCHVPTQQTGLMAFYYNNFKFNPYSDFAVHDMGYGLADRVSQGNADGQEFRSAPLWGTGQRIFFLHDGRTTDLLQAIAAHASPQSEANAVINNFNLLPAQSRQDVLDFLRSL